MSFWLESPTTALPGIVAGLILAAGLLLMPARANADTAEDDDQLAQSPGTAEVDEEADYIARFMRNQAAERVAAHARNSRWETNWDGELEYRFTQLQLKNGVDDNDRDVAAELGCTLKAPRDWELHLALVTRREDRPTSNWIPLNKMDDERPLTPAYWVRKQWKDRSRGGWLIQWGRFEYPYDLSQIMLDNDLLLRAGLLEYTLPLPEESFYKRTRLSLLAAQLLEGQEEGQDPAQLLSARLDTRWERNADARFDAALVYHSIGKADTIGAAVAAGDWRVGGPAGSGETTNYIDSDTGRYVSKFASLGLWFNASLGRQSAWPLSIEGELDRNLGAAGPGRAQSDAYYAALNIGRKNEAGCWRFGVDRAYVEKDAALAAVNRGEYATNYEGTRLSTAYCPAADVECRLTYTWSHNLAAGDEVLSFNEEELNIYFTYGW